MDQRLIWLGRKVKMTPEQFKIQMKEIDDSPLDEEQAHIKADMLMCELLESLGYGDGAEIFICMNKWYG